MDTSAETGQDTRLPLAGEFRAGASGWGYARGEDGAFDLWPLSDEATVPDVAAASRKLRSIVHVKRSGVRIRIVPAPFAVLDQPMTWHELRAEYDRTLKIALRLLGVDATDFDTGGMPSEYRGWMAYASQEAQRFLAITESDRRDDRRPLASEITMGSSAVAFATRYGFATVPFTVAVALVGLQGCIAQAERAGDR